MANLNNLVYDSDFPQDKIVLLKELNWTSGPTSPVLVVPHGLKSTPFVNALASADNWATAYSNGTKTGAAHYYEKQFIVGSDAVNLYVSGYLDYYNTVNAKVRVWGVFDEAMTQNIAAASTTGNFDFLINTNYNYPKLYLEGTADATTAPITIQHNLGFVPYVELWIWDSILWGVEKYECWVPACTAAMPYILEQPYPGTQDSALPPALTASQLILRNGKYHYRIYHDKAI